MKNLIIILLLFLISNQINAQNTDSLSNYLQYAIDHNPEIQVAAMTYNESLEKIDYLSALPDPTVSFGYFISPVETRNGAQLGKISISQMFPWFGTLSNREKQAATLSNSLYNKYIDKRNQVIFQTKKEYFNLFFLVKKKELIEEQINLFQRLEDEALIKVQTSNATSVDVLIFQMAISELQTELQNTENQIITNKINFNLILNRNENKSIYLPDTLILDDMEILTTDSIFQNNPQISASEDMIKMYSYKYKADKRNTLPKFGIGLDYIFIDNNATTATSGKDAFMPMISVSLPIWTKKNKAINSSNTILINQAEQQKIATTNSLNSKFQTVKYNYEKAYREYNLYTELVNKAEQSLQILYSQYATSSADYDQIIFLQNTILKYKIRKIRSIVDTKIYKAEYEFLTGKN